MAFGNQILVRPLCKSIRLSKPLHLSKQISSSVNKLNNNTQHTVKSDKAMALELTDEPRLWTDRHFFKSFVRNMLAIVNINTSMEVLKELKVWVLTSGEEGKS